LIYSYFHYRIKGEEIWGVEELKKALLAILLAVVVVGVYGLATSGSVGVNPQNSEWAHPENMATIEEVKTAIDHPAEYVIIDATKHKPDKSVKRAIWISFKTFRQSNGLLKGIWGYPIKPGQFDPTELQHIFRQLGVSEGKTVIVLARDPTDAGVAWFAL